ncbi:MAG: LysR family transcriptional regulator [Capsulimonadaceae bacterium]|nr:LysR family transcriptional regulator [Capsulimonadaceae bacterium]
MELRHLRYFVAVAEELHFGRAAARLHLAQPPLTRQIQQLEMELKAELFQRTKRRVALTEAGRVLLVEARALLEQADGAIVAVRRAALGETGWLGIGFVGTAAYEILPDILRAYRQSYPDVELVLREMNTAAQLEAIHERRIHVGLVRPSLRDTALAHETIQQEPLVIVLWEGHPLAKRAELSIADLREQKFVLYPRTPHPNFSDQTINLCISAGFVPDVVQEAQEIQTAISLVSAGMGVTLAPGSIQRLGWPGIVYKPIAPPTPTSDLIAAYRPDDTSPVLRGFLEVARRTA